MFKNLLLCHEGSGRGRNVLAQGAQLAVLLGARVHVLSIVGRESTSPVVMASVAGYPCFADEASDCQRMLDESVELIRARGIAARGYLAHGNYLEQIAAYAKKLEIDLIVISDYPGSGPRRWWSSAARASLAEVVSCCILVAGRHDDRSNAA